jgi:hypothetical protein
MAPVTSHMLVSLPRRFSARTSGAPARYVPMLVPALCVLLTAAALADNTVEAWRTSPYHGVPNAATGLPIPCRCRYQGRDVMLGTQVCMNMPNGTMLARCDLHLNNSTWVPLDIPCNLNSRNQSPPERSAANG